jgi:hypothetical protein
MGGRLTKSVVLQWLVKLGCEGQAAWSWFGYKVVWRLSFLEARLVIALVNSNA